MTVLLNPDCLDGKHRACSGDGWCEQTDQAVPCPCECHAPQQPTTHAIQAKHLSGASIGKLVEWELGRSLTTNERQWSPTGTLLNVWHAEDSTEIAVDYDRIQDHADTYDQIGLKPDDWVRITQVPAKGEVTA